MSPYWIIFILIGKKATSIGKEKQLAFNDNAPVHMSAISMTKIFKLHYRLLLHPYVLTILSSCKHEGMARWKNICI